MCVRLLHCMRVRLHNGYTRAYSQIMQHTHMHKAVTECVEAKKLLSRRRQSNYGGRGQSSSVEEGYEGVGDERETGEFVYLTG